MTIETEVSETEISQRIYSELYQSVIVAHMTLEQIDPENQELKLIEFGTTPEDASYISFTTGFEGRYGGQGLITALYSYKYSLEQEIQVRFRPSETL